MNFSALLDDLPPAPFEQRPSGADLSWQRDPEWQTRGGGWLIEAVLAGDTERARCLLAWLPPQAETRVSRGFFFRLKNVHTVRTDDTPLICAARMGRPDLVELLLAQDTERRVAERNVVGSSALFEALKAKNEACVALLAPFSDPAGLDASRQNAFSLAAASRAEHPEFFRWILSPAAMSRLDGEGTPLIKFLRDFEGEKPPGLESIVADLLAASDPDFLIDTPPIRVVRASPNAAHSATTPGGYAPQAQSGPLGLPSGAAPDTWRSMPASLDREAADYSCVSALTIALGRQWWDVAQQIWPHCRPASRAVALGHGDFSYADEMLAWESNDTLLNLIDEAHAYRDFNEPSKIKRRPREPIEKRFRKTAPRIKALREASVLAQTAAEAGCEEKNADPCIDATAERTDREQSENSRSATDAPSKGAMASRRL